MYTDIVGSTELTRTLDPERYGVVLDRFLAISADAVHAFEGTVNQFTGDGLLAVFGAPLAHEDHAQRACMAVLRIQREVAELAAETARTDGIEFAVRCGLNSGEVIVGAIGDDVHMDFVPIGSTTALGKRIESLAPVGSIAISASTAALVQGEFELRELGEFEIKGMHDAPARARARRDPARRTRAWRRSPATRGLSPFVGRDAESAQLRAALEDALAGNGRADRDRRRSGRRQEPSRARVRRGLRRARPAGVPDRRSRARALRPIAGRARAVPGLLPHRRARHARDRARADRDHDARPRSSASHAELPLLFELLGVPDPDRPQAALDPEARQQQLLALMSRVVKARSRREPAVHVIEDLQWIDDASAAFVEQLVEAVVGTRTLLIATYRPEHEAAWASSGAARRDQRRSTGWRCNRRSAHRAARPRPLPRRSRGTDRGAHRRQPVLHRGDRPGARRERPPHRRPRALPARGGAARRRAAPDGPGGARGAHRPVAPSREGARADDVGDRQRDSRDRCCAPSPISESAS